jgi:hypothetical protein
MVNNELYLFYFDINICTYSVHPDKSATIVGQTKEDINTKSVTINTMKSASYIIGGGGELNQGPCVVKKHFFWCGNIGYPTMSECLRNCPSSN